MIADEGVNGTELWKSDGTSPGTTLVSDINPGSATSDPKELTNVDGTLFLVANDGAAGHELWQSDGTGPGTSLVSDINPGSATSNPLNLTAIAGTLFLAANDGVHGAELWKAEVATEPPPAPDFSVAASPASQSVVAGNATTYEVTITASNGFDQAVDLSVAGLPAGASGSFSPNPATGSSTLAVSTTADLAPGDYTLTITGSAGDLSHSTSVTLSVTAAPSFSLSASPASQSVAKGASTT